MTLIEYIKSKRDFLFPILRGLLVVALVTSITLIVSTVKPNVGVYFDAHPIKLPNSIGDEHLQLLTVKIEKHKQEQVDIDNIIISPCVSVNGISSINTSNVVISNSSYFLSTSDNVRSGKALYFKGLSALPAGESELTLFFWGVFDFPEIIAVTISSPNLGLIKGKSKGLPIVKTKSWVVFGA